MVYKSLIYFQNFAVSSRNEITVYAKPYYKYTLTSLGLHIKIWTCINRKHPDLKTPKLFKYSLSMKFFPVHEPQMILYLHLLIKHL